MNELFIILFLHQTTTASLTPRNLQSCLSSCSYIKPQLKRIRYAEIVVVYHLVPTSNHNDGKEISVNDLLFIILFLHQTTTHCTTKPHTAKLFIILFLHQTTTFTLILMTFLCCLSSCSYIKPQLLASIWDNLSGCLSSCSYIKPQLKSVSMSIFKVVYHLVPTSNHNLLTLIFPRPLVVYHLVPTSNHNL